MVTAVDNLGLRQHHRYFFVLNKVEGVKTTRDYTPDAENSTTFSSWNVEVDWSKIYRGVQVRGKLVQLLGSGVLLIVNSN